MPLPLSGPLSLLDIQTEFDGNQPVSMSEYYKGGTYVNSYSLAPNVPVAGPISISNFYGASHYVPQSRTVTLADGEIFTVPPTIQGSVLSVSLVGAAGGTGGNDAQPGYPGYPGRLVTGLVTVSAGFTIRASVGGAGVGGGSGGGAAGGTGGYGGVLGYTGGRGGNSGPIPWSGAGGGGGGGTAIALNGVVVGVAGGGAGGGGGGCFSAGRPSQGYSSSGSIVGGTGSNRGGDGGGPGGGGGGQLGGVAGAIVGGDNGSYSGSSGGDLIPPAGSSTVSYGSPGVTIQGTW